MTTEDVKTILTALPSLKRSKDKTDGCPWCGGEGFGWEKQENGRWVLRCTASKCSEHDILTGARILNERKHRAKEIHNEWDISPVDPDLGVNGHAATDYRSQTGPGTKSTYLSEIDGSNDSSMISKGDEDPFPFLSFDELCNLPPPIYQVEDFFLEESLVQVFGETSHGKSLLVWDLACSICLGAETWFGRKINIYGPVVWINADGGRGLTLRAKAWREANGANMKHPLHTLMGSVHLNHSEQIGKFRRKLLGLDAQPVLVVFDTQSRCMPGGRENDPDEMTLVTEGLHRIKTDVGCTTLPIHHANVAGLRERGSGVVKNESDTQIRVTKDKESGIFTVKCVKGRDHPEFRDFYFKVQPVLESVVVVQHDSPPNRNPHEEKMDRQFELARLVMDQHGITYEEAAREMGTSEKSVRRYAESLEGLKVLVRVPLPNSDSCPGPPKIGLFPNPGTTDPRMRDDD